MFTLALKQWGAYESLRIDDVKEITGRFPDFIVNLNVEDSQDWACSGGLNFAIIMQRKSDKNE